MRKNREIKVIFAVLAVFFAGFLAAPMISVLVRSFTGNGEPFSFAHYAEVLTGRGFLKALGNSLVISVCSALLATVLAFILAYTIHYTNAGKKYKWLISKAAILPIAVTLINNAMGYIDKRFMIVSRLMGDSPL